MIRSVLLIGTTAFWITMMSQLIHREFFQISTIQSAYEVIPITSTPIRESYQAVYLGQQRVGFEYKSLQKIEDMDEFAFELQHNTYLAFRLLGRHNEMNIQGAAWLNERLYLQSFAFFIRTKDHTSSIKGKIKDNVMEVEIQENDAPRTYKQITIEGDILHSEVLDHIWTPRNLHVGKSGQFRVWNPIMFQLSDLDFKVVSREKIAHANQIVDAYKVRLGEAGTESFSWIDANGNVLRKELPNGLVLVKQQGYEIFDALRSEGSAPPDLPNLYSLPSNEEIEDPNALQSLRIRIKIGNDVEILELEREDLSDLESFTTEDISEQNFEKELSATEFIQSEDPKIVGLANEITGNETSLLRATAKISDWVHDYITPVPTVTIPSATQVLHLKKGDCNEYTVLFTALARAAGIPTRSVAGLVYQGGRFFYHSWALVYVGRWISVDPTFGQLPADITHIPLAEGDMKDQINLANKIGQIQIFILNQESS